MSPRQPRDRARRQSRQRRARLDAATPAPAAAATTEVTGGGGYRRGDTGALERRAARRHALLDAATDAIRRHGDAVSMDELAAAAGVTKPILYRHFGDRRGLVAALAERFAADLMTALRGPLARPDDPRQMVLATIDAFVAFIESDPAVYRFVVQRVVGASPDGTAALSGFLERVGNDVALVLGEQLRAAGADSGAAEPVAHGLVGMVHAAGDWWLDRRTMPRARLVEYLGAFVWGGLTAMGVEGGAPGSTGTRAAVAAENLDREEP